MKALLQRYEELVNQNTQLHQEKGRLLEHLKLFKGIEVLPNNQYRLVEPKGEKDGKTK